MTNQQAKEILDLYRPDVDDADPQFAEALELARRDPELGRWFSERCRMYRALHSNFKDISVPPDLKQRILGEPKAVSTPAWWLNPAFLAAAAAIVITAGAAFWFTSRAKTTFVAYQREMTRFVAEGYKLDVSTKILEELRMVFAKNDWPSGYVVPRVLENLDVEGGCLHKWRDCKVSLLCLEAEGKGDVWLFVVPRANLPDAPASATPKISTSGKLSAASWSAGDYTYLLVAEGDEAFVKSLL